jgi:hypothetical protein
MDQADLEHPSLELVAAHDVVDAGQLAEHGSELAAVVARGGAPKVRAHPPPEVDGLAHVDDAPDAVPEEVDTRRSGQSGGERELADLGMALRGRETEEVVEPRDAQPGGSLNRMSKLTLWPTMTASPRNSTRAGRTSPIAGAGPTMDSVIPVK